VPPRSGRLQLVFLIVTGRAAQPGHDAVEVIGIHVRLFSGRGKAGFQLRKVASKSGAVAPPGALNGDHEKCVVLATR